MRVHKQISIQNYEKYYNHLQCQLNLNGLCEIEYEIELTKEQKTRKLLDGLMEKYPDIIYYTGKAEMGYDDKPTLLFNWNRVKNYNKWESILESKGIELDWDDEWTNCFHCNKLIRTTGDSYGWEPSYIWLNDYEIVCIECIKENKEWIDESIENYYDKENRVYPSWMLNLLEEIGFKQLNEKSFETGFNKRQNDDPIKELNKLKENDPDYDKKEIVFIRNDTSQFYLTWDILTRNKPDEED